MDNVLTQAPPSTPARRGFPLARPVYPCIGLCTGTNTDHVVPHLRVFAQRTDAGRGNRPAVITMQQRHGVAPCWLLARMSARCCMAPHQVWYRFNSPGPDLTSGTHAVNRAAERSRDTSPTKEAASPRLRHWAMRYGQTPMHPSGQVRFLPRHVSRMAIRAHPGPMRRQTTWRAGTWQADDAHAPTAHASSPTANATAPNTAPKPTAYDDQAAASTEHQDTDASELSSYNATQPACSATTHQPQSPTTTPSNAATYSHKASTQTTQHADAASANHATTARPHAPAQAAGTDRTNSNPD